MFSQPNYFKPPNLKVPNAQRHLTPLDGSVALDQLFGNPSTTVAASDMDNLDSWAPARSTPNANDPTMSGFGTDNPSQNTTLLRAAQSFRDSNMLMETAGQSMTMPELSTAVFDDDLEFLEDILLPEFIFNPTGFTTPMPFDLERTAANTALMSTANESDTSQPRLFLPRLPPQQETQTSVDQMGDARNTHVFDISASDVEQFKTKIAASDVQHQLTNFPFPKRSRILRCLSAYFEHLDSHMPFIQHATFSLCGSAPELILGVLALGATISAEHNFASSAYEAACTLLDQKLTRDQQGSAPFAFWPIQATLLCVHYGAFTDNATYRQRSQDQFSLVSKMLQRGLEELNAQRSAPSQDWTGWSFVETFSRLACWTCAMSGILLAHDDSFHIKVPVHLRYIPLPLEEDLWRARSAHEWADLGGTPHQHGNLDFLTIAESLFQGEPILDPISCFGILAMIGWILLYICNHERVTIAVGSLDMIESEFTSRIDKGLGAWETLTRRHLRTGQVMFRQLNPLINDSFPFLGMAYYHIHVGEELRALKELATDQAVAEGNSTPKTFPGFIPGQYVYKAVRYAANSWLVRAKLGISHFQQFPNPYGVHGAFGAYEAGKWSLLRQIHHTTFNVSAFLLADFGYRWLN